KWPSPKWSAYEVAHSRHDRRTRSRRHLPPQQHRITVGKEPVTLPHRMAVSLQHTLLARKRRHQHQQRALRQMEIGDQRIHAADAIARIDENPRLPRERPQLTA